MTDGANADFLEVLLGEAWKDLLAYLVLAECRFVSFEAKLPQPTSNIHGGAPGLSAIDDPLSGPACLGHCWLKSPLQGSFPTRARQWQVWSSRMHDEGGSKFQSPRSSSPPSSMPNWKRPCSWSQQAEPHSISWSARTRISG